MVIISVVIIIISFHTRSSLHFIISMTRLTQRLAFYNSRLTNVG